MPSSRATNVRFVILFLTVVVAFLLYLDRVCLGFAAVYVAEDVNLDKEQMGVVMSAFFFTYALFQVPAGWLSDRFGARIMLTIYLAAWSACTGLMGLAGSMSALVALRLGCGLFQAGAYPTSAGLVRRWIPHSWRGLASAIVAIGGRLGGAFAFPLTAYLIMAFVPADRSAALTLDDVLSGRRKDLALALTEPQAFLKKEEKKKSADPEETRRAAERAKVLQRIAEEIDVFARENLRRILILSPDADPDDATLSEALAGVNQALARRDLWQDVDAEALSLPSEGRRNLGNDAASLTKEELERRNRLILEAVLPELIRKLYGPGWRPTLGLYGVVGVVVALLFFWAFRDEPRQHPGVNEAEATLIEGAPRTETAAIAPPAAPPAPAWQAMLTSRSLWLMNAVQFLTNLSWAFLITWFPGYMAETHRLPMEQRGWMTSLPMFVGIAGMFAGGGLTDWAARRLGIKRGRQLPIAFSRFLAGAAFFACLAFSAPWPIIACMAMVALATDLGTPAMWAYALDVGGRNTGVVLGWSNMWGNFGAVVSPILLGAVWQAYGPEAIFVTCGAGFALAGILSFGIDATRPLGDS